jgi:hypothetical protein
MLGLAGKVAGKVAQGCRDLSRQGDHVHLGRLKLLNRSIQFDWIGIQSDSDGVSATYGSALIHLELSMSNSRLTG